MANEEKDRTEEEAKEAEGEKVAEQEEAAEEEEAAAEEEEAAAEEEEEPESGDDQPAPGQETLEMASELEEGWPRSWIVTTAILGIVAIIIIARLVGQSWKKDIPVPRPGQPGAKVHAPGKVHEPGKRPAPSKVAPGKNAQPAPGAAQNKVIHEAGELLVPSGSSCFGKDGKLHKQTDPFVRPEVCMLTGGDEGLRWYEVSMGELSPPSEVSVSIMPPKDVEGPFAMSYAKVPEGGKVHWVGGNIIGLPVPTFGVMVTNHMKEDITIHKVKLVMSRSGKRSLGEVVKKVLFSKVELPGVGTYCLDASGKAVSVKAFHTKIPEVCKHDLEGANSFRLEFGRKDRSNQVQFLLRMTSEEFPPGVEGFLTRRHGIKDPAKEVFQGNLFGKVKKMALLFTLEKEVKSKVLIDSILLMGKKLPALD